MSQQEQADARRELQPAVSLHREGVSSRVERIKPVRDSPGRYSRAVLFDGGPKGAGVPLESPPYQVAAATPGVQHWALRTDSGGTLDKTQWIPHTVEPGRRTA